MVHSVINVKMKVNNNYNINKKHDIFYAWTPLNTILRIFGLSYISRHGKNLKYSQPILKILFLVISLGLLNVYTVYYKYFLNNGRITINFTNVIQFMYLFGYFQYVVDMIFVCKYGKQTQLDYIKIYENIDKILGIRYYDGIRKSICKMAVFFIVIGIISIIMDYSAWVLSLGWLLPTLYSIEYIYIAMNMLTCLDVFANASQLEYRLKVIGDLLEDFYCKTEYKILPAIIRDVIKDNVWMDSWKTGKSNNFDSLETIKFKQYNVILWLNRSYLLLIEQCNFINTMFGFRVFLSCISYLLDMVILLNLMVRLIVGTVDVVHDSGVLPIISTTMRVVTSSLVIFCGIHRCEQTYRQLERIVRLIDHLQVNKKISSELQESLKELKELIKSRPIKYHAINFFKLEYSTLVSMASVIVTYTIILLQNMK